MVLAAALLLLSQDFSSNGGAEAWSYDYTSSPNRRWLEARQWCQEHYTDMVFIRSKEENDFLNKLLPFNPKYYWIGVRREDGKWTWAPTMQQVPQEAQNWAENEPDDIPAQDCVEIYIKREADTGQWNNESCRKRKGTICYSASCKPHSCSAHADCVETIGNYTCRCHLGFQGSKCEEAITCKPLLDPEHGSHSCVDPYGPGRFNSSCQFQCELGFQLVGVPQLLCQSNGQWDHPVPLCQVKQCPVLNNTIISAGTINCSHPIAPYSYNSTCKFTCNEGFEMRGQDYIRCEDTSKWTASVPTCTAKRCPHLREPTDGSLHCTGPHGEFSFGSRCKSTCDEGFLLNGTAETECTSLGRWSAHIPNCTAKTCPTLSSPSHGVMVCSGPHGDFKFGSWCTTTCEEGFVLHGSAETNCTSQGRWSTDTPHCLAKKCPPLSSPLHGSLSCSDPHGEFSFASRCTSKCQSGFILNGTAETECTSLGKWTSDSPRCFAHPCPLLDKAPQHGNMNCSHLHSPFSFGSFCDFECNEGFRLGGKPTLMCNESGLWSQNLPTCQPVQCGAVQALSLTLSMNCSHPLDEYSFGSQCYFSCKEGYSLNGTEILFCSSRGIWNDSLPYCMVEGMPLGASLLMYTGVGAAAAVVPLLLVGLIFLIMMQLKKGENPIVSDAPAWGDRENPAFEF